MSTSRRTRSLAGVFDRRLVAVSLGVLLSSADTYVVVVTLPSIMDSVGVGIDHLERATPVISGYLLGYVVLLPLLGRLSDLVGRGKVLGVCLVTFGTGSLVTATSHALPTVVAGRVLQGIGGGGLVPVALGLVAATWTAEKRGLPLGVVGAVQELGSVLGPLYGAAIVLAAGWRWIFWLNLPLAALIGWMYGVRPRTPEPGRRSAPVRYGHLDLVGLALLVLAAAAVIFALDAPGFLANSVTYGELYSPAVAGQTWGLLTTPIAFLAAGASLAFLVWETAAPSGVRVLLPVKRIPSLARRSDLAGALLLAGLLACVIVAFSTTDPSTQAVAGSAPWILLAGVVLLAGLVWRQQRADHPILDMAALGPRAAWGSLLVNLLIGVALMAVLVDVPLFARATKFPGSEIDAALVLVRLLVAVPFGAVAGGLLCTGTRRWGLVAFLGMAVTALALWPMTSWGPTALSAHLWGIPAPITSADIELVVAGLGFGIAIAPVNAAILGSVPVRSQGLAAALVVVAKTVGMLVGISVLTAIGIHNFYRSQAKIGSPAAICPRHPVNCRPYEHATTNALIGELHTVFGGAAISAGLAALLALALLSRSLRGSLPGAAHGGDR